MNWILGRVAGLAAGLALLGACSTIPAARPAGPTDDWIVSDEAAPFAGLSLHRAGPGYAGRVVLADGKAAPVRNIVASEAGLAFIVPALDLEFAGRWDSIAKRWTGVAKLGGREQDVSLARGQVTAQAADPYVRPQQLVRLPDGREMNLYCLGKGSPVVVLDYGAGGTAADWSSVHAGMAATTRVCAYDRAGQGFSDPGPLPRDAAAVVEDMRAMLKAAGIPGPYVLAGHSMASLHVRLFANRHPDEVAGIVLVDPSGDFQNERVDRIAPNMAKTRGDNDGLRRCIAAARAGLMRKDSEGYRLCRQNDPDLMESRLSESEAMQTASSEQTTRSRRFYGDMPLIVLTRGDNAGAPPQLTQADIDAFYGVWQEIHREFAALSSRGVQRIVPGARHYIQRDKPEAVIAAVAEVVAAAR